MGAFVVVLPRLRPRAWSAVAIVLLAADLLSSQPVFPLSGDEAPRRTALRALSAVRAAVPRELFRVDFAQPHVDALAAIGARVENVNGYWPLNLGRFFRYVHARHGRDHRDVARYGLGEALYSSPYPFERSLLNVQFATRTRGPREFETARGSEVLPRAWVVGQAEVIPSAEAALRYVLEPGFDPRAVVVLEDPPAVALGGPSPGHAVARRVDDGELEIDTDTSAPGYLVLSEVHYPGWHATVDGQPVRYWYDPLSVRLGLLVSGLSLVCVLGVVVRARLDAPERDVQSAERIK